MVTVPQHFSKSKSHSKPGLSLRRQEVGRRANNFDMNCSVPASSIASCSQVRERVLYTSHRSTEPVVHDLEIIMKCTNMSSLYYCGSLSLNQSRVSVDTAILPWIRSRPNIPTVFIGKYDLHLFHACWLEAWQQTSQGITASWLHSSSLHLMTSTKMIGKCCLPTSKILTKGLPRIKTNVPDFYWKCARPSAATPRNLTE